MAIIWLYVCGSWAGPCGIEKEDETTNRLYGKICFRGFHRSERLRVIKVEDHATTLSDGNLNEMYNKHAQRACLIHHAACKTRFQAVVLTADVFQFV